MVSAPLSWKERAANSRILRVFSYRDFRLLWIGAFLSFTGSWIQNVAQGFYVFETTGDEAKLAFVSFANSIPVFLFGFVAGGLADRFDKRRVLIATQLLFGVAALYLAWATYTKTAAYWQFVAVGFVTGLVGCVEMPTRQSVVSRVVPAEELSAAVPVNAMTFNVSRIFGPAIGGVLLTRFGVPVCYLVNGLSFLALVWAARAIRSDLGRPDARKQPLRDLLFEGALYTWRDDRLRTLLILETIVAVFGIFYLPLIPAYVRTILGLEGEAGKAAIAHAYVAIGVGALFGLLLNIRFADSPHKGRLVRGAMVVLATGLIGLALVPHPLWSLPILACTGGATIVQFNGTNTLFQVLAPERIRGRVLSMHIWALNGLSPFGVLAFGWLAKITRTHGALGLRGVALAMAVGGACVAVGAVYGWFRRGALTNLAPG